jgi:hypothetical protein
MISSFTVGSIFRIVNEASPSLRAILADVRKLNLALDQARANLAAFGKSPVGLTTAIGETSALAKAWKDVAANARLAQGAIGAASTTAARTALPAAAAAATGGRPPRGRAPSWPGRGGGGGGAATSGIGAGGGAGGYVEHIITSPAATYTYAVGAGSAGVAGTAAGNGGAGAAGILIVEEHYGS